MKVLAIGRPRTGVDASTEIARHAREEPRALWTLYNQGAVREMYSPAGPGAVLVLETRSLDEADGTLSKLPLVRNDVIEFEPIELRPFAALQLLFSKEDDS